MSQRVRAVLGSVRVYRVVSLAFLGLSCICAGALSEEIHVNLTELLPWPILERNGPSGVRGGLSQATGGAR